jgi:hypothetical protein
LTDPTRRVEVIGSFEIFDNMTGRTGVYADRSLVIEATPPQCPSQQ